MRKQTRTNTKSNPAFDPSELADLIHTPAVGSGVSSHLLHRSDREPQSAGEPYLTTVVTSPAEPEYLRQPGYMTTEAVIEPATVAAIDMTTEATSPAEPEYLRRPGYVATVVESPGRQIPIWVSESGNHVAAGKVRPHVTAEDALSAAEKAIYELLESIAVPQSGGGRTAQAGYQAIMRKTGLSKKTVQRTIDKLLEKEFLAIAIPSDSHYRTPTTYTVSDSGAVLVRHIAGGRRHIARFGPGVAFVRLLTE